jgi:hypothetical protein
MEAVDDYRFEYDRRLCLQGNKRGNWMLESDYEKQNCLNGNEPAPALPFTIELVLTTI